MEQKKIRILNLRGKENKMVDQSDYDAVKQMMRDYLTEYAIPLWMERKNPQLGGKTPNEVIAAGRVDLVMGVIDQIRAGSFV